MIGREGREIRYQRLDADDQAKMDELRGPRAAGEQRTHDLGGGFVVEPGRRKKLRQEGRL